MTTPKETLKKIRNHVSTHKFAYVASAAAIAVLALQQSNRKEFYAFLESKGIDPEEYYCPEAYEERKNQNV